MGSSLHRPLCKAVTETDRRGDPAIQAIYLIVGGRVTGEMGIQFVFNPFDAQTHKRIKRTLFIRTKTQSANYRGNPLCESTKLHLNNDFRTLAVILVSEFSF